MMKAVIFDMDGVLIDVSRSYLATIKKVYRLFTGLNLSTAEIAELRNQGGFNNDWDLTWELIKKAGKNIPREKIVPLFQKIYRGDNFNGLILKEKWLLEKEILQKLNIRAKTAIVTGRPREEAFFSLRRFSMKDYFSAVVTLDDIPSGKSKPHPWGLRFALSILEEKEGYYVGDTGDDIIASLRAGLTPIGIVPPGNSGQKQKHILLKQGASLVLDDINKILEFINDQTS
ncbi:MAG: HAD family hydrolase [Acidobacteriota bacterium]